MSLIEPDSRFGDRRRRHAGRGPSARAAWSTPTPPRPGARSRSSRTSSATRCCRLYAQHAHRGVGHGPAHDGAARGGAAHHPSGGRAAAPQDAVLFCGTGATGAIDKLIRAARARARARGRSCSSAPTSTTRTSCRGASRPPTSCRSARTPRVASTSTTSSDELRRHADRAREDRQLLRRLERHRDRHGRRPGRDHAAPPRRARVLGLRGRRPVPADRHERLARPPRRAPRVQGRGLPLAPQVRRRPRDAPACSSPSEGCCATACRPFRAAGRSCSSARRRSPITPTRRSARRAARRRSWSRSAPGSRSPSRRRSASRRSAAASTTSRAARCARGRRIRGSRSSAARLRSGCAVVSLGLRHPPGHLHASFVVAVLSDLFGIQARSGCFCAGPVHPPRSSRSTSSGRARMQRRGGRGHLGAKLAFTRLSFPYYTSEAAFAYVLDAVHLLADQGWKLLPQYRFDRGQRPVGAPRATERRRGRPRRTPSTRRPRRFARAPESVLPAQLNAARSILRAAESQPTGGRHDEPPLQPRLRADPLVPAARRGARAASRRRRLIAATRGVQDPRRSDRPRRDRGFSSRPSSGSGVSARRIGGRARAGIDGAVPRPGARGRTSRSRR